MWSVGVIANAELGRVVLRSTVSGSTISLGADAEAIDRELQSHVGEKVLRSGSVAMLDEALGDLLEDEEFHRLRQLLLRHLPAASEQLLRRGATAPPDVDLMVRVLGAESRIAVERGARLAQAIACAIVQFLDRNNLSFAALAAPEPAPGCDPLAFLAIMPIPVARSLLGQIKAELCLLAIRHARQKCWIPEWLGKALAERWEEGTRQFLSLLATLSGVEVPEDLLPQSERINPISAILEHLFETVAREELQRQACAAGAPVYPCPMDDDE